MPETKTCSTCNDHLSCKTELENYPCFGCSEHKPVTPLSCPRSFSFEHVYDTSEYDLGKLTCLNCGLKTTVAEARVAHNIRGF